MSPKNFEFVPGIFDLIGAAKKRGFLVIVVTNQAGIGRGYYTEADFWRLTEWMHKQFAQRGACIDGVYFCPFHPEHGVGEYRKESDCRKPAPGMLLQAQQDHDLDLGRSILVGDKPSDMEAGKRAGVGTLIYLGEDEAIDGVFQIDYLNQAMLHLL